MVMLWGRNGVRYGGHVCERGVSICPPGLVGWARDDDGAGGEVLTGCGEGCSRLGSDVCQLNFYPRDQANSKWGVLVIKAVYRCSDRQNLTTQKLRWGSGVVCIDLPSQVNCAMHCLREHCVNVPVCVVLSYKSSFRHRRMQRHLELMSCLSCPFIKEHFLRERALWHLRPWKCPQRHFVKSQRQHTNRKSNRMCYGKRPTN